MKSWLSRLGLFLALLIGSAAAHAQTAQVYCSTINYGVVHVSVLLTYSDSHTVALGFYEGGAHLGSYQGHIEDDSARIASYGELANTYNCTDAQLVQLEYHLNHYEFDYNALYANCGSIVDCDLEAALGVTNTNQYQDTAIAATLMDWALLMGLFLSNPFLGVYEGYSSSWSYFTDIIYYYNYVRDWWDSTVEEFYYGTFVYIGWWFGG